jgi:hypothetical protein
MKNYEERLNSIYQRADAYKKRRARSRRLLLSAGMTAVCAAVILSVALLRGLLKPADDTTSPNPAAVTAPESGAPGVVIPALELPETDGKVSMSMIGLVVYGGRIYTQAQFLRLDEAGLDRWLGEKLGTAAGNLNEWSSQSEYGTEFASTVTGDVYAVSGFDRSFRICVPTTDYDGRIYLSFFENLNGLTVHTGADLYEKLRLKENYTGVTYQLHEDWDTAKSNTGRMRIYREQIGAFVDALYDTPFEDLSQGETLFLRPGPVASLFQNGRRHLGGHRCSRAAMLRTSICTTGSSCTSRTTYSTQFLKQARNNRLTDTVGPGMRFISGPTAVIFVV